MTAPVGIVEVPIAANAYTFVGIPLYTTITYQGIVNSVSGAIVSVSGTPFASLSMTTVAIGTEQVPRFFLELTSGTDVGAMIPILSNDSSSVTLSESVASYIATNDTIKIRPLHTLDSLFPGGAPLKTGVSVAAADEVFIYDATRQAALSYFYHSTQNGWRRGSTANGNRPILPHQSIYINHKAAATTLRFSGAVKMGTTGIDIIRGYNFVPNPFPVAYSLSLSNLFTGDANTGMKAGVSSAAADLVTIYGGSGAPKTYFYHSASGQWRTGTTNSNSVVIPVGGSLLIHRKADPAFTWAKTQPF